MRARLLTAAAVVVASSTVGIAPAEAGTVERTSVVEAADFASAVLGDPWDYSNPEDLQIDGNGVTGGISDVYFLDDGTVRFVGNGMPAFISPHLMAWPGPGDNGALHELDDGLWTPIDATRFTDVSLRIFASEPVGADLSWFTEHDFDASTRGAMLIPLSAGWNVITRPIVRDRLSREWDGDILGLRLDLPTDHPVAYRLDWLRVTEPVDRLAVTSSTTAYIWDVNSSRDDNGTSESATPWHGPLDAAEGFAAAALPPGRYHLAEDLSAPDFAVVEVRKAPRPVILDPDATGGEDYATAELGDPWDFSNTADVRSFGRSAGITWSGGVLSAVNHVDGYCAPAPDYEDPNGVYPTGWCPQNDPFAVLPLAPGGLDPVRYHRVSMRTWYDGPFSLADAPGGGTHGRLIWRTALSSSDVHSYDYYGDSREMVFFTDRSRYVYDLLDTRWGETSEPPDRAWSAAPITFLRFDPHEDRGERRWYLDDLRIAADDEAAPTFAITWQDRAAVAGTTATIRLDADRSGFDGEVLAVVPEAAGVNRLVFDARDRLPARGWISVELRAPNGDVGRAYSSGPLAVSARVRGSGRVETAIALSAQTFPAGTDVAVIASSAGFADALAASQLAAALGGPILLTVPDRLDGAVVGELRRLGVERVYLAGGEQALSAAVADAIPDGIAVERIGGTDRYETAALLAARTVQVRGRQPTQVVLASGESFPDALAATPMAVAAGGVVLLTRALDLPSATREALQSLAAPTVIVLGGSGTISQPVQDQAARGRSSRRVAGADRYATAALAYDEAVAAGADPTRLIVASGEGYADALAAAAATSVHNAVLLLVRSTAVPPEALERLASVDVWTSWRAVGGSRTISHATLRRLLAQSHLPG